MEEFLVTGLIFTAIISLVLCKILLAYGKSIDQYPIGRHETREISLWSPQMFTQLSVLVFWPVFVIGAFMVFQQSRFMLVGGIALIIGLMLYLGTAVVFSGAVLKTMASTGRENNKSSPARGVIGRLTRFSSKPGSGTTYRPGGKTSQPGFSGYKK